MNKSSMHPHTNQTTNISHLIDSGPFFDKVNNEQVNIFIPSILYVFLLMLIGTPGNALVCYVNYFKWTWTTSRCFVFTLAAFDLINNVLTMPVEIAMMFLPLKFDMSLLCKFSRFGTFLMNNASSIVLVGIAVDRFRRICRTLKPNLTVKHAKIICWASLFFSLVSSWPALLLYGTNTVRIPITKTKILVGKTCLISDSMDDAIYPTIYLMYLGLGNVVIDLTLMFLYVILGRQICKQRTFRSDGAEENSKSLSSEEAFDLGVRKNFSFVFWRRWSKHPVQFINGSVQHINEQVSPPTVSIRKPRLRSVSGSVHGRKVRSGRTTLMLFLVTVAFVLSFVPYLVIVTLRVLDPNIYLKLNNVEKSIFMIFLRSYLLQSAINPIIYSFINKQFRIECKNLIFRLFCKTQCCCKE